jgi:SMC interacting uncharacterized protein involved in chromosome segregation
MQELENRLNKAEWTLELHENELQELRDTSDELRLSLRGIQQSLSQIKWVAIGVGLSYFAQQFGLSELLRFL